MRGAGEWGDQVHGEGQRRETEAVSLAANNALTSSPVSKNRSARERSAKRRAVTQSYNRGVRIIEIDFGNDGCDVGL